MVIAVLLLCNLLLDKICRQRSRRRAAHRGYMNGRNSRGRLHGGCGCGGGGTVQIIVTGRVSVQAKKRRDDCCRCVLDLHNGAGDTGGKKRPS